jgi:outer membrane protein OmpA-like peptidoglycan-associated protein
LIGVAVVAGTVWGSQDVDGSRDHPLFNRLPDYFIDTYEEREFDSYDGFVDENGAYKTVEGHKYYINYYFEEGTQPLSEAAVLRNYRDAFTKIGGVVHYQDGQNVHMSLEQGGRVTWVRVNAWNGGQGVGLYIVEEAPMEQVIVADAAALAQAIGRTGKAAVYGIYFDTGKVDVKAESEPALQEIAKLLQENPDLQLFVVGHTDNVGGFELNLSLSRARAEAVVKALVADHGVQGDRLEPHGVASLAPVATNETEDGRALNRRCELVRR